MTSLKSAAIAALFALGVAAPAFAQSTMAPSNSMSAPSSSMTAPAKPAKPAKVKKSTAGRFKTEAEAKASCPMDTVVWASTKSKAYHLTTSKLYGKTKSGAFECKKSADEAGYHAAKN